MHPRTDHRKAYWERHDKTEYECPDCGRGIDDVRAFQVHHKDGDPTNGDPDNLIALCRDCHHDRHGWWIQRYRPEGQRKKNKRIARRLE